MGQIIVRNLDDEVISRLKRRAAKANKSLEQTVRDILTEATKTTGEEAWAEVDRLREEILKRNGGPVDFDFTAAIREDRDNDEPYR
jgi:plasmid stability protein